MNKKKDISSVVVIFFLRLFHIKINDNIEKLLVQIFKFGIVGVIATVIDFLFLYIFRDLCGLHLVLSNTLAFFISVIYNYIASMIFVFNVDKSKSKIRNFIIFVVCSFIGLLCNDLILYIITEMFDIYYMISKVIATIFVMVFNFVTRKKFLE